MDTFKLVLLYCFAFAVAIVAMDFYLIVHGYEQFSQPVWAYATAGTTGEIIMFTVYQIAKKSGAKIPRFFRNRHTEVNEMEEDNERNNQLETETKQS